MKKLFTLLAITLIVINYSNLSAQTKSQTTPVKAANSAADHGKGFVDKNGDGYNDNAPDHDGDGIPNGLDPDYKGVKMQKNKFVDLNGDGINDNAGKGMGKGKNGKGGFGAGKVMGTNNKAEGSKDCTQTGANNGTGRGYKGGKK